MDNIPDCSVCDYLKKIFYKEPKKPHHINHHSKEHIKTIAALRKKYQRYSNKKGTG